LIPLRHNQLTMKFFYIKIFALLLIYLPCVAQKKNKKTEIQTLENLHNHIQYLADDKLEGRRTGTNGERLAMEYISNQFKTIGLTPKGTEEYYQAFDVNDGKQMNSATQLIINDNKLDAGKDFFVFPFSPNQTIEALPAIAIREADMPWFIDLKETFEENKDNPHFDLIGYIKTSTEKSKNKGASAIIFYNTSSVDDKLQFDTKDRSEKLSIPVLYINKEAAEKYFKDASATLSIKLKADIGEKKRVGHNVIGYIDNGAATTVILGAHFDHLGYGEDGNSMLRTGEHLIHNGADDNASGTAALIELARKLKTSAAKNNNYLFIAFSGEELGLFGSKYFTEYPTVDLKNVDYMINMDMVGRLNDSTKIITIGGYGTSPAWGEAFSTNTLAKKNKTAFVFKYDSSGTGPSDHTSFYRKDIPVLFYFTGLHSDYHKPTDDADKINYNGEAMIIQQIYSVIESLNNKGKLAFTKTRETQTSGSARFAVTLGIMPDYSFAGTGVRADGVSDGRPAQKAGLKAGDVIIQLGENNVTSLENYMQALGKFKKGDKTKVKFKRGSEILEATVEF
ncbi:MAG TPA: M20/M25/M40 family metallo-hydrolase, partial [Chitinophagaceae bacterium]|nr:M20/M25/M40 family metallo-hydrolase [Chitinophagaceae bacterium]